MFNTRCRLSLFLPKVFDYFGLMFLVVKGGAVQPFLSSISTKPHLCEKTSLIALILFQHGTPVWLPLNKLGQNLKDLELKFLMRQYGIGDGVGSNPVSIFLFAFWGNSLNVYISGVTSCLILVYLTFRS